MVRRSVPGPDEVLAMVGRVDEQYRAVWNRLTVGDQIALALYFLPHASSKASLAPTRPRVAKWYCPFAHQSSLPTGHRYCINVYSGCAHGCAYCYAMPYSSAEPHCKLRFAEMLAQDMQDLERFDVPPAPVHMSNSTDPFQTLEIQAGHARVALEQVLAHRRRFTTVTILTKNPLLPVRSGYLDLFKALADLPDDHRKGADLCCQGLPAFCVEVSLAFWSEEARQAYDPSAPPIAARMEGIRAVRQAGIPVVLRIDPLLPRSPLRRQPLLSMAELGLVEAQTLDDLEKLVCFAREVNARHVVYSPMKIVQPRGRPLSPAMRALRGAYEAMAHPQKLVFRGGAWRLPDDIAREQIVVPFLAICRKHGVEAKFCMANLIETP